MEDDFPANYAEEHIPEPHELIVQAEELSGNLERVRKHKFQDLFHEVERKGAIEYCRNTSIWGGEIDYNTWDKKVWEELEKEESERRKMNEVKGLYIFYENSKPIYVGISRAIIRRLKNHFLGRSHFEASLVYLILRDKHDNTRGLYQGERATLPQFLDERASMQAKMRADWDIRILPMQDNYMMYFIEFYLACKLKTKWNSFETH